MPFQKNKLVSPEDVQHLLAETRRSGKNKLTYSAKVVLKFMYTNKMLCPGWEYQNISE
jgi:hypothetical protein